MSRKTPFVQTGSSIRSAFRRGLTSAGPFKKGSKILLAVSGGVDSMTMLRLFADERKRSGIRLAVAHVNHGLRGKESDDDEAFVASEAKKLKLEFRSVRLDLRRSMKELKLTKHAAARLLRYEFFEKMRRQLKCAVVATAHNADDSAETVVLNSLRGTGRRGLAGIPSSNGGGTVVRPMLHIRRTEIEAYAFVKRIPFRFDSSNASTEYSRNRIRLRFFPFLRKEGFIDPAAPLIRLAALMTRFNALLDSVLAPIIAETVHSGSDGEVTIDIASLITRSRWIRHELIVDALRRAGVEPTRVRVGGIDKLIGADPGDEVTLTARVSAFRERDEIVLLKSSGVPFVALQAHPRSTVQVPSGMIKIGAVRRRPERLRFRKGVEFVDAALLTFPLTVREWTNGDRFVPLGMDREKKLSDFFIDAKVPLYRKKTIPVVESNGAIVWVAGYRLDDRFKITDKTMHVITLEYTTNG